MNSTEFTKKFINPIIHNPVDNKIYCDDPSKRLDENYVYENPIVNQKIYSLAKSGQDSDQFKIVDAFYNNDTEGTKFADQANDMVTKSLSGAVITSKEYSLLADTTTLLGTLENPINTGILTQIFETINTDTLVGKYRTMSDDLVYFTNLAEGKSPEPTFGSASEVSVEVPKHGGAVAITDRARQVIAGADAEYRRLISRLQDRRALSESIIVRTAIEAVAATNNQAGVDFGATTGTPAVSTYNPGLLLWPVLQDFFDGKQRVFNAFVSNALPYYEYIANNNTRGFGVPAPTVSNANQQAKAIPGLEGVTWFVDNLMTTLTEGYAMDRNAAGKNFRGPTRAYTVTDPDNETEKYVTKSHFECVIVDGTAIARVTGIQS